MSETSEKGHCVFRGPSPSTARAACSPEGAVGQVLPAVQDRGDGLRRFRAACRGDPALVALTVQVIEEESGHT